jgi:tetratricopeptide (TPR) repeat protein
MGAADIAAMNAKLGRNEACPCRSGKKFKKCCALNAAAGAAPRAIPAADAQALHAMYGQGRYAEVEARAHGMLAEYPNSGLLWKLIGASQWKRGRDALGALQRVTVLTPGDPEAHGNLGNWLRSHGRFEEAAACQRRAIDLKADYAEAHNNLGSALQDQGRIDEALASYRRAAELKPDFAMAHHNLGIALAGLGRYEEAAVSYRRTLKISPQNSDVHNNLGNVLRDMGLTGEAATSYRRALSIKPASAELHNNLGNALLDLGQIEEAAQSYLEAIELRPEFAKALGNLGSAYRELGKFDEAESCCRQAVELAPDFAELHTNLGVMLRLQGRPKDAELSGHRALELNPKSPATLSLLAEIHADKGEFPEAEARYNQALSIDPDWPAAWAGLAVLRKMKGDNEEWLSSAQRIADKKIRPREEMQLRFAMGKYFDDVGQYEAAFANYRRANELAQTARPPHDRQNLTRTFDYVVELYGKEWLERVRGFGNDSARPVFVVGMPRSGTSLTEQILASHPAIFGAGELPFWKNASPKVAESALGPRANGSALSESAADYLQLLSGFDPNAERVVDKMPANFAYLGMIHAALPNARIIHMRRNPIDTCLSIYFQNFHIAHSYTNDLDDLAHCYTEYLRVMNHWRSVLPEGAILDVPYESLVDDQELWSRRIVDFVGLPWSASCLEFHRTVRRVSTFSKWQVRQKISKSSVERWRHYAQFVEPLMRLTESADARDSNSRGG